VIRPSIRWLTLSGNKTRLTPGVATSRWLVHRRARDFGDGANQNHDWDRYGYDCGGLVRYSVQQGAGVDLGQGTGAIDSNPNLSRATDLSLLPSGSVIGKAQPGDVPVFRPDASASTEHTGIYIGNGFMINAPNSGNPVRVDPVAGHGLTDILRLP
jgi:cell wall-associated NlpC family hydrolase